MDWLTALFCDIWLHLSEYKERYIIIAAVFAFRSIFKWFLQGWAIRMEYEIHNSAFWNAIKYSSSRDKSAYANYRRVLQQLMKKEIIFNNRFRHPTTPNMIADFKPARELILKDLESRNLWSLFVTQRILWKLSKLSRENKLS